MKPKSGYGLLKNNKILGFSIDSAGDDAYASVSEMYTLDEYADNIWIVRDKLQASYVRMFSTESYNAGYETPMNHFKPEELSVVKIDIKATVEEPEVVPSFEKFMILKYNTIGGKSYNPDWYNMIMDECKRRRSDGKYSIYDLRDFYGKY